MACHGYWLFLELKNLHNIWSLHKLISTEWNSCNYKHPCPCGGCCQPCRGKPGGTLDRAGTAAAIRCLTRFRTRPIVLISRHIVQWSAPPPQSHPTAHIEHIQKPFVAFWIINGSQEGTEELSIYTARSKFRLEKVAVPQTVCCTRTASLVLT